MKRLVYKIKFNFFLKDYLKLMRHRKKFKNLISILKFKIFDIEYNFEKYFTNKIFDDLPINFSIFFRQHNFSRLIRPEKINFFILKTKKFHYPLTNEQIKFLKKNGFSINSLISNFLFFLFTVKELLKGLLFFLLINFNFILNFLKFKKKDNHELFILNLSKDQILSFDKISNNIENWIKDKFNLNKRSISENEISKK